MIKKILIGIVVLAAIWGWPAGRAKVMSTLHPLFARLGPVGAKVEGPMKKYTAKTQVTAILRAINHAQEEGKDIPDPGSFTRWLRAHPIADSKEMDPWGNAYYMIGQDRHYIIGSRGPDGVRGNTDDISTTATF